MGAWEGVVVMVVVCVGGGGFRRITHAPQVHVPISRQHGPHVYYLPPFRQSCYACRQLLVGEVAVVGGGELGAERWPLEAHGLVPRGMRGCEVRARVMRACGARVWCARVVRACGARL